MAERDALTHAFLRAHPAEAAQVLESVSPGDAAAFLESVPARLGAGALGAMIPGAAARCVAALDDEHAAALLAALGTQPAVLVLRHVGEPRRAGLLARLPTATALASRLLLTHPEDTVGAWADPDVVLLGPATRADAALERVRAASSACPLVLVLAEGHRLAGIVAPEVLLRAPGAASLDSLMARPGGVLAAGTPLAGAAAHPGWQKSSVLPVVESGERLLGVLTHDALERALRRGTSGRDAAPPRTVAALLARGYWEVLSGIVQSLTALLPAGPRLHDGERP